MTIPLKPWSAASSAKLAAIFAAVPVWDAYKTWSSPRCFFSTNSGCLTTTAYFGDDFFLVKKNRARHKIPIAINMY